MMGKVIASLDLEVLSKTPTGLIESIPLTRGAKSVIGYRYKVGRGKYQVAILNNCPWCSADIRGGK
jgi:hypothetical protein